MSKVSVENNPKAYLAKQNEGLRDQITLKEREIENVKKLYDAKLEDQKRFGEDRILRQHDQNQAEIASTIEQKQERLESIRQSYQETLELLENERAILEEDHSDRTMALKLYREGQHRNYMEDAREENFALQQQARSSMEELREEHQWKLSEAHNQARTELQEGLTHIDRQREKQRLDLDRQGRSQQNDQKMELQRLKLEHQQALASEDQRHREFLGDKELQLESSLKEREAQHSHLTSQKEKVLEHRYNQLIREHDELMNTTRTHLENSYQKMVNELSSKKTQYQQRAEDPFYRVQAIEPEVIDQGDQYLVRLQVSEHERPNVSLSPNGRSIKISLVRNFSDRIDDEQGFSSSKRSESFSRQISVPELVSSRGVTQRYEDGILEFLVKKA